MGLQEELDAFKAKVMAGTPGGPSPARYAEITGRATAELIASGAVGKALRVGDRAPAFTLNDQSGAGISSTEALRSGPLVLTFYRGVWCPFCNMELEALAAALPQISAAGARLVAISPQTPANSRKTERASPLGFPILHDPGGAVAAAFGVRFALPDYLAAYYKELGIDLSLINADDSWTLPMPARYVIAPDGVIRYAQVNPDYTQRPDPQEMMASLRAIQTGSVS